MSKETTIAAAPQAPSTHHCFHCGNSISANSRFEAHDHAFCCHGCQTVFELLTENGLGDYYALDSKAGIRVPAQTPVAKFAYLDEPSVRQRLVNFSNDKTTRVLFRIPAIHCIACVWLLENLFRLNPAVG